MYRQCKGRLISKKKESKVNYVIYSIAVNTIEK